MKKHPRAILLSDETENKIRHDLFVENRDPYVVAQEHGIGIPRLRRICCGTVPGLNKRRKAA